MLDRGQFEPSTTFEIADGGDLAPTRDDAVMDYASMLAVAGADATGSASQDDIQWAESLLNLTFPADLATFLRQCGGASGFGLEIFGITARHAGPLSLVGSTIAIRREGILRSQDVVVYDYGFGPVAVVDCTTPHGTVYAVSIDGSEREEVAECFSEFVRSLVDDMKG